MLISLLRLSTMFSENARERALATTPLSSSLFSTVQLDGAAVVPRRRLEGRLEAPAEVADIRKPAVERDLADQLLPQKRIGEFAAAFLQPARPNIVAYGGPLIVKQILQIPHGNSKRLRNRGRIELRLRKPLLDGRLGPAEERCARPALLPIRVAEVKSSDRCIDQPERDLCEPPDGRRVGLRNGATDPPQEGRSQLPHDRIRSDGACGQGFAALRSAKQIPTRGVENESIEMIGKIQSVRPDAAVYDEIARIESNGPVVLPDDAPTRQLHLHHDKFVSTSIAPTVGQFNSMIEAADVGEIQVFGPDSRYFSEEVPLRETPAVQWQEALARNVGPVGERLSFGNPFRCQHVHHGPQFLSTKA